MASGGCDSNCGLALGLNRTRIPDGDDVSLSSEWQIEFQHSRSQITSDYGYHEGYDTFKVKFCLAEPLSGNHKVVLSNYLLLGVIVAVFATAITCTAILWNLRHQSLVTPGDAIESFIMAPDRMTAGLCTLDVFNCRQFSYQIPKVLPEDGDAELTTSTTMPHAWLNKGARLSRVVPPVVWADAYCYLSFAVVLVSLVVLQVFWENGGAKFHRRFGNSEINTVFPFAQDYSNALLFVNLPQIFVSTYYYYYNALFTHLQVEHEWSEYSLIHKPLRVSYPKGQQISSYRLQLPYRHSIPLILGSALFHWLVGNTIFIFVVEGGFRGNTNWLDSYYSRIRTIGVLNILFITTVVLSTLPFLFSQAKVKGSMPSGRHKLPGYLGSMSRLHPTTPGTDQQSTASPPEDDIGRICEPQQQITRSSI
ncbi:hypothetical protein F4808DRAFT_445544 [Astrocystis sublimbata]|nr:hypothetical protein F4808DRAFT_445544 [Astrocystis sublimbata]